MSDGGDDVSVGSGGKEDVEEEELFERKVTPGQALATEGLPKLSPTNDPSWLAKGNTVDDGESEPKGWWGHRMGRRPWRERGVPERKRTIPVEQEDRWTHTRQRVSLALRTTIGYTLDVTHEALEIGQTVLRFVPIAGLDEAANVLLTIWEALQLVETNRLACLRLTERCADILLSIREEIYEAGDKVGEELSYPLNKLTASFKSVHILLQKQVHRPFLKRYLKRDEILRSISACDTSLSDALSLFSVHIQIRTLKQLQAAEIRRQAEHERLMTALTSHSKLTDIGGDETPRPQTVGLPLVEDEEVSTRHASSGSGSSGPAKTHTTTSTGQSEQVRSPPPTPDSEASQKATPPPSPPSVEEVQNRIKELVQAQSSTDHELDMEDLRALMRAALATANDAEMMGVLQVQREEMPEALKTLQRALEVEREKHGQVEPEDGLLEPIQDSELKMGDDIPTRRTASTMDTTKTKSQPAFSNLRRRLTLTNQRSKSSRSTATLTSTGRSSGWSGKTERDTLDREFIESGIDALRRLSIGQDINLPSWTITRYEVDLEERIGIGFFSDVYRASWHNHTVAVKVLSPATSKRLFLHEMSVWKKLQHSNVLVLLGASSACGDPPWFFVSPFLKNGNLVAFLKSNSEALEVPQSGNGNMNKRTLEKMEKRMMYEVAKGMEYLHRMCIKHGDLKGANVLIDDDLHCVLADFGQSEMKSEFYRISGTTQPRGTLRWQAPELMDGSNAGVLTREIDVYAFSVVCVEIFNRGALPWGNMDDDSIRKLVVDANKRPPVPVNSRTKDLMPIVEKCWAKDPTVRPTFAVIVQELKKKGANKYADGFTTTRSNRLWDEAEKSYKRSPDIRPSSLPEENSTGPDIDISTTTTTAQTGKKPDNLSVTPIPVQRIITPINEEERPDGMNSVPSPVSYRPIMRNPVYSGSPDSGDTGHPPAHDNSTSTSSRTGTTDTTEDTKSEASEPFVPGLELAMHGSPPPADDYIAQRKCETRYRNTLQHDFHPSLTLPLWNPSPIALGAVGYLSRQTGTFETLFNAFDPGTSSGGKVANMPSLYGYGKLQKGQQRQDKRNVAQRFIEGLLWFRTRKGDFQQSVSRQYSYPIRAGHRSAYLCTETTVYRYMDNLNTPKSWFVANVDQVLELYGKEHSLSREDVLLVVGTLDAENYGLFVNHNNPDGQVHFNVFSPPKDGQPWGVFATDTDLPATIGGGPTYDEDFPGKRSSANKVSKISSGPWDTVLLARLRFKPDSDRPTSI